MTAASTISFGRISLWIFFPLLVAAIFYLFLDLIIILGVSVLLALIFNPLIKLTEKLKIGRGLSTLAVFIAFSFLVYLGLSIILPQLVTQMNSLIQNLGAISIQEEINKLDNSISSFLPIIKPGYISKLFNDLIKSISQVSAQDISSLISNIFSFAAVIVIVPFTTFFIAKDYNRLVKGFLSVLPNKYFEMSYWVIKKIMHQLGRYVRGWIFDAAFVGIACGTGFYLIGIDNALALGIVAGVGHLVPYFGPIIGGIPAMLISLLQLGNFSAAPLIIIVLILIYTIDNGFVQPYVFSKSVNMHPLVIILLIIAGSKLFGIFGMLFAVPTASVIRTTAREIYFAFKNYSILKT